MENLEKNLEIDWKEKYQRTLAEFDNWKKRLNREKEDLVITSKSRILEPIMDMYGDLILSTKYLSPSELEKINPIINKFNNWIHSMDIELIDNTEYDPDKHEVVSIINSDKIGILDVVSLGWALNGKIIKYSKIILSKNE
jgi:molecular chaperone GrpE